jgi:hypothetical protein
LTEPDISAKAEQVLADAAELPSAAQIRDLADRAVGHGSRNMSTEQIRATAREAVENAKRLTDLLQVLADLVEETHQRPEAPAAPGSDQ